MKATSSIEGECVERQRGRERRRVREDSSVLSSFWLGFCFGFPLLERVEGFVVRRVLEVLRIVWAAVAWTRISSRLKAFVELVAFARGF